MPQSLEHRAFDIMFSRLPVVLWATDTDLRLTVSVGNDGDTSLIGKPLTEVLQTDDLRDVSLAAHHRALGGGSELFEYEWGGVVWQAYVEPWLDDHDEIVGTIGMALDITHRKRLEQQLVHSQKIEAVGRLAGGIAHDFNNVLTVILGNAAVLAEETAAEWRPLVQEIIDAGRHATEMTKQLLTVSRKTPVQREPVDLAAIFREVVSIARKTFDRRIEIEIVDSPRLPRVLADPSQVRQVLLNLCINARDALEAMCRQHDHRPPRLRITTEVVETLIGDGAQRPLGRFVRTAVEDNGVGMSEVSIARVFEPFYTTKEVGKGTGLGLATSYAIIEQHGGWFDVYSEPGVRTMFAFHLPLAEPSEEPPPANLAARVDSSTACSGTVLVADDHAVVRRILRDLLTSRGYWVIEASDGRQAVDAFRERRGAIDLVVMDLAMPNVSGAEAVHEILAIDGQAKVLIVSGQLLNMSPEDLEAIGAKAYLAKPFKNAELLQTLERVRKGD